MKLPRAKRHSPDVKLPMIKDRISSINPILSTNKANNMKLQKINRQRNMALIDIAKIDKIQKQFTILTKRNQKQQNQQQVYKQKQGHNKSNEMRQSRLLLLKNIRPQPIKKNQNLLSSLVQYSIQPNNKKIFIPSSNITTSPTKQKNQ